MKLTLTIGQFDALHAANDKTRKGSTTVKVDKAALTSLLLDHSAVLRHAQDHGIKIEEAY